MNHTPGELLRDKGRYDKTTPEDRHIVEEILTNDKDVDEDTVNALQELGYDIERNRSVGKGKQSALNKVTAQNAINTYTNENSHIKGKRGIKVIGDIEVDQFSHELLLTVKKIANVLTTTLIPLAQKLYDIRFRGVTLQDKNTVIPELYKEMDEKMYILTSLNNVRNAQLIKLDKDFDKLYNLVKNGLNLYVMPTGGSMSGGFSEGFLGGHVRNTTNHLYEL